MKRIIFIVLIIAAAGLTGQSFIFWLHQVFTRQEIIIRLFITLAITVVAIARMTEGKEKAVNQEYLKIYGDIIKDAFAYDKKAQEKLLKGIAFYNKDNFKSAIHAFISLKEKCSSTEESAIVSFFTGLCYDDMGNDEMAVRYYREAVGLNEHFAVAWVKSWAVAKEHGQLQRSAS